MSAPRPFPCPVLDRILAMPPAAFAASPCSCPRRGRNRVRPIRVRDTRVSGDGEKGGHHLLTLRVGKARRSRARTGSDTPMQPQRLGETASTPPDGGFTVARRHWRSGSLSLLLEWRGGEQAAHSQARTAAGLCASRLQPASSPLPGRGDFFLRKKPAWNPRRSAGGFSS